MEELSNPLAAADPATLLISDVIQPFSASPLSHHQPQHHRVDDSTHPVQETEPDSQMEVKEAEEEETGLEGSQTGSIVSVVKEEGEEVVGSIGENGGFEVGIQEGVDGSDSSVEMQESGEVVVGFQEGGCGCDSSLGVQEIGKVELGIQECGSGFDSLMGIQEPGGFGYSMVMQESGEFEVGFQEGACGSDSPMVIQESGELEMQESGKVELGIQEGGSGFDSLMGIQEPGAVELGIQEVGSGTDSSMGVQKTGELELGSQEGCCGSESSLRVQETGQFVLGFQEYGFGSGTGADSGSGSDSSLGVQESWAVELGFQEGGSGSASALEMQGIEKFELVCSLLGVENVGFEEGFSGLGVLGGELDVGLTTSCGDCHGVLDAAMMEKGSRDDEMGICEVIWESDGCNGEKRSVGVCSIRIEMVDGTAVIDVSKVMEAEDGKENRGGVDGMKMKDTGRRSAKRAKHVKGKGLDGNANLNVNGNGVIHGVWREKGKKITYSREELERLRYVNGRGQRKMWYEMYNGLSPLVRKEYDEVGSFRFQKHQGNQGFDNCQAAGRRNNNFHGILGAAAARGRGNYPNTFVY